jgi:hypothetical protein
MYYYGDDINGNDMGRACIIMVMISRGMTWEGHVLHMGGIEKEHKIL